MRIDPGGGRLPFGAAQYRAEDFPLRLARLKAEGVVNLRKISQRHRAVAFVEDAGDRLEIFERDFLCPSRFAEIVKAERELA